MRVDVTFTFHCSADGCDVTDVDHRANVSTLRLPVPREPAGWTEMGLLLFCPRHTLLLQVDGTQVALTPREPVPDEES
jgi:hypothetical protein